MYNVNFMNSQHKFHKFVGALKRTVYNRLPHAATNAWKDGVVFPLKSASFSILPDVPGCVVLPEVLHRPNDDVICRYCLYSSRPKAHQMPPQQYSHWCWRSPGSSRAPFSPVYSDEKLSFNWSPKQKSSGLYSQPEGLYVRSSSARLLIGRQKVTNRKEAMRILALAGYF